MNLIKRNFYALCSLLVLGLGIIIRFYDVPQRFIFDIDTQYQALLAQTIVKDFHVIWIGVSASNIGYYLGPGLVYLTALMLWIQKDPIILGYFASSVGAITLLSVWYVGRKLFDKRIALIAAALYAFTPLIITYDRKLWPIFVPLISVWMLFGLIKSKENKWWLLLCTFLISVSFHIHLSLMIFWPFVLYSFIQYLSKNRNIKGLFFVLCNLVLYLCITSPLLVYDIVHNFDNLRTPLRFLETMGKNPTTHKGISWTYLVALMVSVFFFVSTKNFARKISYAILGLISCAFLVYPGPTQQYYLVIIFIFAVFFFSFLISKLPAFIIIGLLTVYAIWGMYSFTLPVDKIGLLYKKGAIAKSCLQIKNKPYYLEVGSEGRDFGGWYYLFTVYCKQPSRSDVDSMFGWLYQNELNQAPPMDKLIIVKKPF